MIRYILIGVDIMKTLSSKTMEAIKKNRGQIVKLAPVFYGNEPNTVHIKVPSDYLRKSLVNDLQRLGYRPYTRFFPKGSTFGVDFPEDTYIVVLILDQYVR